MFRYDIHVHTSETSKCGWVPAALQVSAYKRLGYDGICITDHLHNSYLATLDCREDWEKVVERYMQGYRLAKRAGDECGLDVIFGVELRFPENDSDYLIYGVDEAWLLKHPYVCAMDHRSFFERCGSEVLIIHAHPYRNCDEVFYDCVHGVEIANCNPRHASRNELALRLALENPKLIRLCGSDAHRVGDEGRAAVLLPQRVHDSFGFKAAIEAGGFELECPEFSDIIKAGERK
ncbi:MAG TPA: PHP domain-containing protein [Eubacteriales bacterium]|nr:PHP domain-containing protein [Clostridia bacterium]HRV73769.1 PHP domain-containing protein [Eubacteriales bacterium]